jgi:hypothetical protein
MTDEHTKRTASVHIQTSPNSLKDPPPWMALAVVLLTAWKTWGLVDSLRAVPWARPSKRLEVVDLVLVLLLLANSKARSVRAFFKEARPHSEALAALWGRHRLPTRSGFMALLRAVDDSILRAIDPLFLSDLARHLPPGVHRGLIDHSGREWSIVDFDPTHMATLQAPESEEADRPPVRRPRAESTAPGYPGRKRADAIRTRTAVLLSHAGMWLPGMAQPGNGHRAVLLDDGCKQIVALCAQIAMAPQSVVVRADGEFGTLPQIAQIAGHSLGWLVRGKEYTLLQRPEVRDVLARGSERRFRQHGSPIVREMFDVPEFLWCSLDGRYSVRTRLIVARTPWPETWRKPSVGHLFEGFVYEIFVTSLAPDALSASEVVSVYLGRGALEATLAQEDREMPTDQWITHGAKGEDLFQRVSQWVWNHRIVLGQSLVSMPALRMTLWEVETHTTVPTPLTSFPTGANEIPSAPNPSSRAPIGPDAPPTETTPAPSRVRFGPEMFKRNEQGQVCCPQGQAMQPGELRPRRSGDRQRFRAPLPVCLRCPVVSQCCQTQGPLLQGRTVDLPIEAPSSPADRSKPKPSTVPAPLPLPPPPQPPAPVRRRLPILQYAHPLWVDLIACELRRTVVDTLWSEHVDLEVPSCPVPARPAWITRDQRAHRRATWTQRIARNDRPATAPPVRMRIHGIPAALAQLIGLPGCSSSSATNSSVSHEVPRELVATT